MFYEVRKGRQCDTLQRKQAAEIEALGLELVANGKAIELQKAENSTLNFIIASLNEELALTAKVHTEEKRGFKRALLRLKLIILFEGVFIVLLLL